MHKHYWQQSHWETKRDKTLLPPQVQKAINCAIPVRLFLVKFGKFKAWTAQNTKMVSTFQIIKLPPSSQYEWPPHFDAIFKLLFSVSFQTFEVAKWMSKSPFLWIDLVHVTFTSTFSSRFAIPAVFFPSYADCGCGVRFKADLSPNFKLLCVVIKLWTAPIVTKLEQTKQLWGNHS